MESFLMRAERRPIPDQSCGNGGRTPDLAMTTSDGSTTAYRSVEKPMNGLDFGRESPPRSYSLGRGKSFGPLRRPLVGAGFDLSLFGRLKEPDEGKIAVLLQHGPTLLI